MELRPTAIATAHDSSEEEGTGPGEYMIADHRQQEAGRAGWERRRRREEEGEGHRWWCRWCLRATTERLGFGEARHVERRRGLQE